MEEKLYKQINSKLRISTTGYRILLVLKSLIQKNPTIDEIVLAVQQNPYINISASKDTIRLDINTLKAAGCVVERPSKSNNYRYKLIKHPFCLSLSDEEFRIFSDIREKFSLNIPINEIFILNDLYKKIFELTFNQNQIDFIKNSEPLNTLNRKIYNELSDEKITNRKIQIRYKSSKYGEEDMYIIPKKIIYENQKVYLWCYNYKYSGYGLLYIDRILKILSVDIKKQNDSFDYKYDVIYELSANSFDNFELKEYEKILDKTNNSITINAKVNNEFLFIQRMLQYGTNFKIITPDFFREKLINKIKLIQTRYR